MKTLTAFWHWALNEKPESVTYDHVDKLSATARLALDTAKVWVSERARGHARAPLTEMTECWPAVRDLSIELCRALEKMHELVPEAAADAWLAAQYPQDRIDRQMAMVDEVTKSRAFEGVDSGRYEGKLADAKPKPLADWVTGTWESETLHVESTGPYVIRGIDLAKDAPEPMHAVARRLNEQLMNADGLKALRPDPYTEGVAKRMQSAMAQRQKDYERAALTGTITRSGSGPGLVMTMGGSTRPSWRR